MSKTIVQVPVNRKLRNEALSAAQEMGFSSLQEPIRVFLSRLASRSLTVTFEPEERLSPHADRRYAKILKAISSGKEPIYQADSAEDLLEQLYGKKNPVQSDLSKTL